MYTVQYPTGVTEVTPIKMEDFEVVDSKSYLVISLIVCIILLFYYIDCVDKNILK
jgi:hypothetical protein